jgi:hypothetical protein
VYAIKVIACVDVPPVSIVKVMLPRKLAAIALLVALIGAKLDLPSLICIPCSAKTKRN